MVRTLGAMPLSEQAGCGKPNKEQLHVHLYRKQGSRQRSARLGYEWCCDEIFATELTSFVECMSWIYLDMAIASPLQRNAFRVGCVGCAVRVPHSQGNTFDGWSLGAC